MSEPLRFLSAVRRAGADVEQIIVRVQDQPRPVAIHHYGPGDVIGLASDQIVRREPAPNSVGFAPNMFAFVELRDPDLPWQLVVKPVAAPRPWLALVVVPAEELALAQLPGAPLPSISVAAADLPDPAEAHAWVHAQIAGDVTTPAADALSTPRRGRARVVCPRRLEPNRRYAAYLVPTFEAGRLAGIGKTVTDPRSPAPAWTEAATQPVVLPVYDAWLFATGDVGDFEMLARRLRAREIRDSDPLRVDLSAVTGERAGAVTPMPGVLRRIDATDRWDAGAREAAATQLRAWLAATDAVDEVPVVGPPHYGRPGTAWSHELDGEPRWRAAAGLGAEVVRRDQEALVDETWRQLGELRRINALRDRAALGDRITAKLAKKHLAPLGNAGAAVTVGVAARRIRVADSTASEVVRKTNVASSVLSSTFRRLVATRSATASATLVAGIRAVAARTTAVGVALPPADGVVTAQRVKQARGGGRPGGPRDPIVGPLDIDPDVLDHGRPGGPLRPGRPGRPGGPLGPGRPGRLPVEPREPVGPIAPPVTARRRLVLDGVGVLTARPLRRIAVARPAVLDLDAIGTAIVTQLASGRARERLASRIELGPLTAIVSPTAPAVAQLDLATSLFDRLVALDRAYVTPGIAIEPDSVGMLAVNARFVESFLAGANHELLREMIWRGAEIDVRATPLRQFFDLRGASAERDIEPFAKWSADAPLGENLIAKNAAVVVIRGELVRRFPDALVYIARAARTNGVRKPVAGSHVLPRFRGTLTADTILAGFDRTPAQLRSEGGEGWFVVIAERQSAPRFGLDEPAPETPTALGTWNDLTWKHVTLEHGHVAISKSHPAPANPGSFSWQINAAHIAGITLQRPVTLALHAADLLPEAP